MEQDIYNYLMAQDLPAEMSDDDYIDLMVWHRGLAVPAARNLDDPQVQQGKQLFTQLGCATCHRPSWTTGDDVISDPNNFSPVRVPICFPAIRIRRYGRIPT